MNEHYQQRYLCSNWEELATRLVRELANDDEFTASILLSQSFIPAGNTLLAGAKEITPNCAILGLVTDANFEDILAISRSLWTERTGIGFDLSGLSDPVTKLKELSIANHAIELGHRPKRGNMAVLRTDHPRILEFINCKTSGNELYNFNISVAVDTNISDELLHYIARAAWTTGDPGLVFLDRAQDYGPVFAKELGPIVTCVPCGEQFMHAFETCNLGSINLNADALMDHTGLQLDRKKLKATISTAVKIMDSVVDRLVFPTSHIKAISLSARRIGLGVMGWADLLARQGLAYNSPIAIEQAKELSGFITTCAEEQSRELAINKGCCKYSDKYRNLSLTCIAPTGGITGLTKNKGYSIEPFFEEASRLTYREHIDMQAAWQSGMHNSVSKTINFPATASIEDFFEAFKYAMGAKVKGITVYRDGSKDNQPVRIAQCPDCI
jgi:ribonucleoside-diphosphate reductase alpha chain